jgi:hypothetical protein
MPMDGECRNVTVFLADVRMTTYHFPMPGIVRSILIVAETTQIADRRNSAIF